MSLPSLRRHANVRFTSGVAFQIAARAEEPCLSMTCRISGSCVTCVKRTARGTHVCYRVITSVMTIMTIMTGAPVMMAVTPVTPATLTA